MKRKMKIIAVICLICIALVTAALYFVPWPTYIEAEFQGVLVATDGQETEVGQISISGWKFNYLFKDTRMDIDIDLPEGYDGYQPKNHGKSYLFSELWPDPFKEVPYLISHTELLSKGDADPAFINYAFSIEDGKFILWNKESADAPFLVGFAEDDCTTSDIINYFSKFVEACMQASD